MKTYTIGNYQYTNTHMLTALSGFVGGFGYGMFGRKGIGSSLFLGVAGALIGMGTAILIQAPTRIS